MLLVLAVGVGSGAAGVAAGVAVARPPTPRATATPVADTAARVRRAVDRDLASVVTVVADLPPTSSPGGTVETTNLGSGVVVSGSGIIITNYHVVVGATSITVVLSTGERRPATLVADDSPFNDLAILRAAGTGWRPVQFGDAEKLQLGDPVVVISSGLVTYDNQVKQGVVSATHLEFPRPGQILEEMIQTDAAVNHGDSGGALLNADGDLVGIVTTVVRSTPTGEAVEGVALAHSMTTLRPVIDAVIASGVNPRPRMGIERLGTQHTPIDPAKPPAGFRGSGGVLITTVQAGSPALAAGIAPGDIVTAVNGQPISDDAPFVNLLRAAGGAEVRLTVVRDGREAQTTVTPRPVIVAPPGGR